MIWTVSFRRIFFILILALVFAAGEAAGQSPGDAGSALDLSQPLPVDPKVTVGILPNGIHYYIRVNVKPEKRAEFRLVVNAGSVLEDEDQLGLAHFVEHMAFNGTTHFKKQELIDYIEGIGMRFGPDLNGYTSFDETVYSLQVPTDSSEIVAKGFQILEDWAHGVTFDPEELQKERGVVIEEWRRGRGAEARMRDKQVPVLFKDSRYAQRLPIGDTHILESFDITTLKRFYTDWYRPDLIAVIAVGDFDKDTIEKLVKQHFAAIPAATSPKPRTVFSVPDHDSTLVAIATDKEATNSGVAVYYKQSLRRERTLGDYRESVIEGIYNQILNDRLYELTQKPDAPFLSAGSWQGRLIRSKEAYSLGANVKDGGIERGLEAILTEAERVEKYGFTQAELDRTKKDYLRAFEQAYAERDKTPSENYTGEYVRNFLNDEPIPGISSEYEMAKAFVPGIKLADVNRLAQEWIKDKNRVILVNAPDKEGVSVPTEQSLRTVFDKVKQQEVTAYADTVSELPLMAKASKPGKIKSEKEDKKLGTRNLTLANGVRVILKPTDFKADEILFTAYSPGGASLASDKNQLSAMLAAHIMELGGVSTFNAIELQKKLAGKAVQVSPFMGSEFEGISGNASPKDVETMFQLIHLFFTAPRRDSSAFLAFTMNAKATLANRGLSPNAAFQDTLQVTLAQHHSRALPMTSERINEVNLDTAMVFYKDRFADASDFTFIFVGNFDPDSLKPLIQSYLGTLPSIKRKETWKDTGITPPKGVVERIVKKGIEPKSQTQLVFTGPFEYTAENRYALWSMVNVLNIELREQLRDKLGGTYSVSVKGSPSRIPRQEYSISIGFGSAPDRVEQLTKTVFAQIDTLKKQGPPEKDLAKVKEMQTRSLETNLKQNSYWLSQLAFYDQIGEDPHRILLMQNQIDKMSIKTIRDAALSYLNEKNYVKVTLYPEEKPAENVQE